MKLTQIFWMQILTSVFVFGFGAALYVWPIFALRGNWRVAVPLVWVANTWDLSTC